MSLYFVNLNPTNIINQNYTMQKGKKFAGITQNLNRILTKSLQNFSQNTQWTDINNWLLTLQSVLKDYPSPFITQKILLSKRLNQCMNPILPQKIHECVLRIHDIIFSNMKVAADGNINDYIKMFAQDLGTYSISILPYFTHTSARQHRLMVLKLIKDYYLDLGKQLIPMLSGFIKSILPVYAEVTDQKVAAQIQRTLDMLLSKAGRRYLIGTVWSCVLKFTDCKQAGMKYLARTLKKMQFIKGEQSFSQSHGFSEQQQQLRLQMIQLSKQALTHEKQLRSKSRKGSFDNLIDPKQLDTPVQTLQERKQKQKKPQKNQINQFAIKELNDSSEQELNQHKLNVLDHSNQGLKNIKEEQNQNDQQNQNQVKDLSQDNNNKDRKMARKNTLSPFDNLLGLSPQSPPAMSQDAYLMSTKLFSTSQRFESNDAIRLNKVPLVTTPGIQQIKQGIDSDRQQNNFPNSNTLIVSALISCLQEQAPLIKRAALDFMFTHLRIKSQILAQNDKKLLVEALVCLFKRKQISICKRVNRWLFGKEDQENHYKITQKNQFVIDYIINAFKKILQKQPTSLQNCMIPIKILQNFYIQHPHLVQSTLGHISINILRYIFNYGTKSEIHLVDQQSDFSDQILKAGKRFLQNLPSYYPIIFRSLGNAYLEGIQKKDSQLCYEAVKYTDFCYINLMKHEHGLQQLDYITITLQAITKGLKQLAQGNGFDQIFLKDSVLLSYNLIARRDSVQRYNNKQRERINLKYFQQTGQQQLPPERIQYQKQLQLQQQNQQKRYVQILDYLEFFFVGLQKFIKAIPNIQIYEESFKISTMAIVKIQSHLPRKGLTQLPEWFTSIQHGIRLSNPVVSLASIQAMINILMWQQQHPIYNSLKMIIIQQKSKKIGNDYQKLALQKLWALLDFPHMHSKIIDLIISFSKFFPYQFTQTVKRSFTKINTAQKEASIQRFSHFWRLTGFKYKELIISNRQFGEINKVGLFMMLDFLDDPNPLVRHAAKNWLMESIPLFNRIIQPLLHQLMKNCSDWYQTPKGISLIKNVYDTDHVFSTIRRIRSILSNGSFAILRYLYQSSISQALEEMRSKITQIKQPFLTANTKQVPKSHEAVFQRQPVLPLALQKQLKKGVNQKRESKMAYFDILLILVVKYVEGHAIQSMGVQFYVGNSGVNASAVQFLETLLDYIDNPSLCKKIIDYILNPLFKVLKQVVVNRQYIMQIQILNILKNIFFSSSFRKKSESQQIRDFFKTVFTNKTFLNSTLQGLNTPFAYIRSQFISFLTVCIPLIADFLEPQDCTQCIKSIIFNYYRIIKDLRVGLLANVMHEQQQIQLEQEQMQNKYHSLLYSRIIQLQVKIKKQQKYVKLTNNLSQIAKTNQILSILHGLSAILNYFFDLNKLNIEELNFQFTNPYTFFDTFKSIITLGLASSIKQGKLVQKRQFLHNLQTCQSILEDLSPVYETILRSWPLSQQYVRISTEQFSSIGMKFFNFQKFQTYNKIVKQLIIYVEQQNESIWGKIFSITQPMYYRFPKQITDIYLKLWVRQCDDVVNDQSKIKANPQNTEFLMKIIQTIIVNNFPMHIVIHAFLQSSPLEQVVDHYHNQVNSKKGNVLNFEINKLQSKLLFFVYVYFNYVHLDEKQMTKEKLLQIWSLIMKVLKPFQKSKSPLVAIWILEILNLGSKKYSPKQLLVNQKFKSDLHRLINDKLKFIASVAARTQKFFFRDPMMKINFNQEQQNSSTPQYHIVLPLPPTIYQIYKTKPKQKNDTDRQMFKSVRPGDNVQLESKYRLYCFKVLKKLGLEILQNTYLPQKTHWVIVRANEWLDIILPVIQDKNTHNMIYAQCASQIVFDILERARILFIKTLKPKVLQIFNKDDFFICNSNTLKYWATIIDWIVSMDKYNQTFSQYLQKVTLSSSYFGNQSAQNKRRIKSFQRICFILYSGSKDKYAQKIKGLLQKIADVIKISQTAHPALLILILFCIRILILKLSEISLNQLFIDIWPMILALLMQIYSKQYVKVSLQNQVSKNPNLLLASLKMMEMISLTNLGQFAHHQWIFIYDYFGVKLTVPQMINELNSYYSARPQLSGTIQVNRTMKTAPFIYKPYLLNYTPVSSISFTSQKNKDEKIEYAPIKRQIVVKNSFVQDQNQLKVQVLVLMQYLNFVGQYRTYVDWEQVQKVIVDDFIKLDSFIHQIK